MLLASALPVTLCGCFNPRMNFPEARMLSGPALGAALASAMELKGVTQAEVAEAFGVKQPSVSEWVKMGRIHKKHITSLVRYFSTHVGPEHWGLPAHWGASTPAEDVGDKHAAYLLKLYLGLPTTKRSALIVRAEELYLPVPRPMDDPDQPEPQPKTRLRTRK
jgi:predicted XRE-type DNA-binding protein